MDLAKEVKVDLLKKLEETRKTAITRVEYEMAQNTENEAKASSLRVIKILLIQKQYPQLLEKVLPLWNTSEGITLAGIVGMSYLRVHDPETLDQLLRTNLAGHAAH